MIWARLALRELRGGRAGLTLLLACLTIAVAALAGIGSLSASILDGIDRNGRTIVGGDVEMRVPQRRADPAERAAFARAGAMSETIRLRAMAGRTDGADAVLVELKAVDAAYPLYGALRLAPGATGPRPRTGEAALAPALAARLGAKPGDTITLGGRPVRVMGLIAEEPDRLGEGFALGPVVLTDLPTLEATGLIGPGSLYESRYRIRLTDASADAKAAGAALERAFPAGGWEARDHSNAAPALRRFIASLGQFLSLLGLAALAVAGIGVGNGVGSWLEGRRGAIATMKTLGATSGTIARIYLAQILIVAGAGIALGLLIGLAVPPLVGWAAGDALPVRPGFAVHVAPLAVAAAYGLGVAILFALPPLARARGVTAASLFRGAVAGESRTGSGVRSAQGAVAALLLALVLATASDPRTAAWFVGGTAALLGGLALLGLGIRRLAARMPRPRGTLLRLALANLHRPGAPTARLVVALGLGLTLFAALAAVSTSLGSAMTGAIPARAPSYFVLDLARDDVDRFRTTVRQAAPGAAIETVPMLRGAVTEIGGKRVSEMKTIPEGAWILRGDRGLTYAATLPAGNRIVAGKWWPADYAGPPLVSLDVAAAQALGLKIGDTLTVSVLGVEIPARIASFREIDWQSMGFNFAILFAPGALEAAPHGVAATLSVAPAREAAVARAVAQGFPEASVIRIRDVIGQASTVLGQMGWAVAAAGAVAGLAGIAVLVGAVAASRRARTYDAVLLNLLGATRRQVLAVQALEFLLLAALLSALAIAIGGAGGWYLVTGPLGLPWSPDWSVVAATVAGGATLTIVIALASLSPILSARPAAALRDL